MLKTVAKLIGLVGGIIFLLAAPVLHAALALVNFVAHAVILGIQFALSRVERAPPAMRAPGGFEPFVSIHVPAHNEPPELLMQTLYALSRLKWRNYEVLIIDNNTSDESIWRPVEEYCRRLGPKFRFFHVENLAGFKAGALNYVRQFMNSRAEFIFVVDADYIVERRALSRAFRYHTSPKIGLIQFPQDYRNIGKGNLGIALDFKHFFSGYMTMAQSLNCVPSTGTLSLISVRALEDVDGFATESITEDADLGFRLNVKGYECLFVNESIGKGVLPHDLEGLKKQRWRWAFGNAQILKLNWRCILFGNDLSLRQKLGFIAHLTAWFNFNLAPSLSLISLGILSQIRALTELEQMVIGLSSVTLLTFLVGRFSTMYVSLRRDGHSLGEILLGFMTHLGLGWVFSASWIKCIWDHRAPFVRTNKFVSDKVPRTLRCSLVELLLGLGLIVAAVTLALADLVIGPATALVFCAGRFLIYWVARQAQYTWQLSQMAITRVQLPIGGFHPRADAFEAEIYYSAGGGVQNVDAESLAA